MMRVRGSHINRTQLLTPDDVDVGNVFSQGDGEPMAWSAGLLDPRPGPYQLLAYCAMNGAAPVLVASLASAQGDFTTTLEFGPDVHTGDSYYGWVEWRDSNGELLTSTPLDQRGPFFV